MLTKSFQINIRKEILVNYWQKNIFDDKKKKSLQTSTKK